MASTFNLKHRPTEGGVSPHPAPPQHYQDSWLRTHVELEHDYICSKYASPALHCECVYRKHFASLTLSSLTSSWYTVAALYISLVDWRLDIWENGQAYACRRSPNKNICEYQGFGGVKHHPDYPRETWSRQFGLDESGSSIRERADGVALSDMLSSGGHCPNQLWHTQRGNWTMALGRRCKKHCSGNINCKYWMTCLH